MKKLILSLLALISFLPGGAQVRSIVMNTQGGYDLVVEVAPRKYITVTADGHVLDISFQGRMEYYDSFLSMDRPKNGKVRRVGDVVFDYHTSVLTSEEVNNGRLKRAGNVTFEYYDGFMPADHPKTGLMKKAGNIRIEYYDTFDSFDTQKYGKVKMIGPVRFDFYSRSDAMPDRAMEGLLKSIANRRCEYRQSGRSAGSSVRGGQRTATRRYESPVRYVNPRQLRIDGIDIKIVD